MQAVNKGRFQKGNIPKNKNRTRRINTCLNCGVDFVCITYPPKRKARAYQKVKYCSSECRKEYKKKLKIKNKKGGDKIWQLHKEGKFMCLAR